MHLEEAARNVWSFEERMEVRLGGRAAASAARTTEHL